MFLSTWKSRLRAAEKTYPIEVSQASQSFTFPSDGAPQMVLFDKGDKILKTVDFKKHPAELIFQLKNADTVPDRADAAVALGEVKDNSNVVAALGEAAQNDPFWGVRAEALRALGKIGGSNAEQAIFSAANDEKPWVRDVAIRTTGEFQRRFLAALRSLRTSRPTKKPIACAPPRSERSRKSKRRMLIIFWPPP